MKPWTNNATRVFAVIWTLQSISSPLLPYDLLIGLALQSHYSQSTLTISLGLLKARRWLRVWIPIIPAARLNALAPTQNTAVVNAASLKMHQLFFIILTSVSTERSLFRWRRKDAESGVCSPKPPQEVFVCLTPNSIYAVTSTDVGRRALFGLRDLVVVIGGLLVLVRFFVRRRPWGEGGAHFF